MRRKSTLVRSPVRLDCYDHMDGCAVTIEPIRCWESCLSARLAGNSQKSHNSGLIPLFENEVLGYLISSGKPKPRQDHGNDKIMLRVAKVAGTPQATGEAAEALDTVGLKNWLPKVTVGFPRYRT